MVPIPVSHCYIFFLVTMFIKKLLCISKQISASVEYYSERYKDIMGALKLAKKHCLLKSFSLLEKKHLLFSYK